MTEALSLAPSAPAPQRPAELPPFPHNPPPSLPQEETAEDDDGEIACICSFNGDDGNTIQCDKCMRWQHISCYYPPPKEVPDEDQKHYCTDCVPQPDLDARRAIERQRKLVDQRNGVNGVKRPAAKKKKVKDSPSLTAQPNGWPERHSHLHDRKSASPRDPAPPVKKPKTSHRATNSISNPSTRKRSAAVNTQTVRSPSETPELDLDNASFIPQYSEEFLQLYHPHSPQVETDTNILNGIATTNLLTSWLMDPEAVPAVTNGLTQADIFKRWDGRMEDIPGQPQVDVDWVEDQSFTSDNGMHPGWTRLTLSTPIAQGTFIGELRGHVGLKDEYIRETEGRWSVLHHPEPFVFFHPQLPIFIDARHKGTKFRFVRRSCQPNAELQTIITDSTQYHFCFMATRDILAGEEITVGWQVPEPLRVRINSSLALSNNIHPQVRDYFSTWVSIILSNCGPCACSSLSNPADCLMARYDRRGQSPPLRPTKVNKRKKKLAALEPGMGSRSRSTSEVPKDDNMTESRSVSGSRGSLSRDITPTAHGIASTSAFQELSEREKKKLMREEEMFKRQEEESGRQKKKRNSGGGSNLSTPIAPTSARHSALDIQKRSRGDHSELKQFASQSNGILSRNADAGSSTRPGLGSRTSSGKRKSKLSRKGSDPTIHATSGTYTDASVQCDLDEPNRQAERQRKRYVSVTQRLFQRCITNQIKMKADVDQPDAMEIDSERITAEAPQNGSNSTGAQTDQEPVKADTDTVMADVPDTKVDVAIEQAPDQAPPTDPVDTLETNHVGHEQPAVDDPQPIPPQEEPQSDPTTADAHTTRPPMHLDMPPPPLSIVAPSANMVQSPSILTPGSAAINGPLFSPSVNSVVSPSPIRKKLSLSDYTKRSKRRETPGEEKASSGLTKEIKEIQEESPGSAQDLEAVKEVPEEAIVDETADQMTVDAGDATAKTVAPDESSKENIPMTEPAPETAMDAAEGGEVAK